MTLSADQARQLDEIEVRLADDDPRLARQLSRHRTLRHDLAQLGFGIAVLASSGAGIVPLALGLHYAILSLVVVGAVACVVLPTGAPLVIIAILRRCRRAKVVPS